MQQRRRTSRPNPKPRSGPPVIHRVLEDANGCPFERELVHPMYFMRDRFIDLTAMKSFLAPWIREEVKKALRDSTGE